jgi:hypothetical protein
MRSKAQKKSACCGKLQGIKPYRFRIVLKVIRVIRVICEICGFKERNHLIPD